MSEKHLINYPIKKHNQGNYYSTDLRINELDYLRGIAILGVVMVHVAGRGYFFSNPNPEMNVVLDGLSRFCVSFFIFISGAAFSYNYHTREKYLVTIF